MEEKSFNINYNAINRGFGEMADIYDELQETNSIVRMMRQKLYKVILETIKPPADILELNCGSGIDAHYLAEKDYKVLATDISEKMLKNAMQKKHKENLVFKQLNFNDLHLVKESFDLIISNFGGLNCSDDLNSISNQAARILKPGGYFIATVMPRLSLWELALIFKREFKRGLRRINKKNVEANVGGEKIFIRYYSPSTFYKYFKKDFVLLKTKAISVFFPPPTAFNWYNSHLKLSKLLYKIDTFFENLYLFAFCGDYYIAVLQKKDIKENNH